MNKENLKKIWGNIKSYVDKGDNKANTNISNLNANTGISDYEEFSDQKEYKAGITVLKDGLLKTFIKDHAAGAWNESEVEDGSLKSVLENKIVFIYAMNVPQEEDKWVIGKIYFNPENKLLRKYLGNLVFETISFVEGAIYIYNNELFYWNKEQNDFTYYFYNIFEEINNEIDAIYLRLLPIYSMSVPASSSEWVAKKIYFNQSTKLLRYYDGSTWTTIPFVEGAIYVYNNSLYYYDSENEKFIDYYNTQISGIKDDVKTIQSELSSLNNDINDINNNIYINELVDGVVNSIFSIENAGIIANETSSSFGEASELSGSFYASDFVDYVPNTEINVFFTSGFNSFGLVFYDASKNPVKGYVFSNSNVNTLQTYSHPSARYFRSSKPNGLSSSVFTFYKKVSNINQVNKLQKWEGKTILFCGTSIPEGGYPQIVGDFLNCDIINKAVGSSVVSAYKRDGSTIQGDNGYRSFSQTIEEKKTLYSTDDYAKYSYESILLPYLDGTNPFPDLIVLEYGSDYNLETNKSEMPLLNEDVTDLGTDTLTESLGVNFNRCTYTGAMFFIINTIYKYNPLARIVVMGFMNKMRRPEQVDAQKTVAEYWQIPFFDVSELLGWSDRIVVGSKDKFNEKYSPTYQSDSDVTQFRMWCPDDWHPHTNTHVNDEGYKESNYELAKKVASYIQSL